MFSGEMLSLKIKGRERQRETISDRGIDNLPPLLYKEQESKAFRTWKVDLEFFLRK